MIMVFHGHHGQVPGGHTVFSIYRRVNIPARDGSVTRKYTPPGDGQGRHKIRGFQVVHLPHALGADDHDHVVQSRRHRHEPLFDGRCPGGGTVLDGLGPRRVRLNVSTTALARPDCRLRRTAPMLAT